MSNEMCKDCPNPEWCVRHGCTITDNYSAAKLQRLRQAAERQNQWIDEFERDQKL